MSSLLIVLLSTVLCLLAYVLFSFHIFLLCVETDEKDEEIRYDDLYMLHSGKFIFIRFNPDKYINKNGTKIDPCMKKRMGDLHDEK